MSKNHYNIMTSCDNGLINYVAISISAMAKNLKDDEIDFYFFHSRVDDKNIKMLKDLCNEFDNIKFNEIRVPNAEIYDAFATYGGGWVGEAYYSLCAHLLLPESMDRIMYLDAGDVLILGDISDYYNCDFEDKSLVVTGARYKMQDNQLTMFDRGDLENYKDGLLGMLRGLFNSGSYVLNLNKMRKDGLKLKDYEVLVDTLKGLFEKDNKNIYFGDQGLLSVAFVGDMKYYGFPNIRNIWYMPYNFCMWYYDRLESRPDYLPSVVHFAGSFKPWEGTYPIPVKRFAKGDGISLQNLKFGQAEYYYIWQNYALITDEILNKLGY